MYIGIRAGGFEEEDGWVRVCGLHFEDIYELASDWSVLKPQRVEIFGDQVALYGVKARCVKEIKKTLCDVYPDAKIDVTIDK